MMTELVLVEGVSDVQLISYYLQNVYGWKHERDNILGIAPLNEQEHIESLSKNGNQLVLCGVGGNGKFAYFVERHRVNHMIVEQDISSLRELFLPFRYLGEDKTSDYSEAAVSGAGAMA